MVLHITVAEIKLGKIELCLVVLKFYGGEFRINHIVDATIIRLKKQHRKNQYIFD